MEEQVIPVKKGSLRMFSQENVKDKRIFSTAVVGGDSIQYYVLV